MWLKQLFCKHLWKFFEIREERMATWKVYKCQKCNKLKIKY